MYIRTQTISKNERDNKLQVPLIWVSPMMNYQSSLHNAIENLIEEKEKSHSGDYGNDVLYVRVS